MTIICPGGARGTGRAQEKGTPGFPPLRIVTIGGADSHGWWSIAYESSHPASDAIRLSWRATLHGGNWISAADVKWPKYEREERKGREIEKREELKSKGDKNKMTVFHAGVEMLSTTLWVSCSALHTFKAEEWPC